MRPAPSQIQFLLPVWGARHVQDFLEYGLPSMLAPGNIPALARRTPCSFLLLAPQRDIAVIERSEVWQRLGSFASLDAHPIDGLISQSSSTILTLAYAAAIRQAGAAALDTCFVPLVSDYVFADGALQGAVRPIFNGLSGVLAGNFQVSSEAIDPMLASYRTADGALAIPPRRMVELSLDALHPATLASIATAGGKVPPDVNRLFWRAGERGFVGRFFLMHMIALRPERTDFIVAGPSDYSLVPELCASGAVARLTNSDQYFVVERQARESAPPARATKKLEPRTIATTVSPWATKEHRENPHHAVIYHSRRDDPAIEAVVRASGAFISAVQAAYKDPPQPARHHPIWAAQLKFHANTARSRPEPADLAIITGDNSLALWVGESATAGLREKLLGRPPRLRPWHPAYPDMAALKRAVADVPPNARLAVISEASQQVRDWLDTEARKAGVSEIAHYPLTVLSGGLTKRAAWELTGYDCCIVLDVDDKPQRAHLRAEAASLIVRNGGVVVISTGAVFSDRTRTMPGDGFRDVPMGSELRLERRAGVRAGAARRLVQSAMMDRARIASRSGGLARFASLLAAVALAPVSLFCNFTLREAEGTNADYPLSSAISVYRKRAITSAHPPSEFAPPRPPRLRDAPPESEGGAPAPEGSRGQGADEWRAAFAASVLRKAVGGKSR